MMVMIDEHLLADPDSDAFDQLDLVDYSHDQLRSFLDIVNSKMRSAEKGSLVRQSYKKLRPYIVDEMNYRPVDVQNTLTELEQRTVDLVNSTSHLEKGVSGLLENSSRHDRSENNRSDANELAIEKSLIDTLKSEYDEVTPFFFDDGVILRANGNQLVQWDSILKCRRNDEYTIYFVEIKEIPNPNDIIYIKSAEEKERKATLAVKIQQTNDYFSTLPEDDSKCKKSVIERNKHMRPFTDCKRFFVYASGRMPSEVIEQFKLLAPVGDNTVAYAYAQSDHYSGCEILAIGDEPLRK